MHVPVRKILLVALSLIGASSAWSAGPQVSSEKPIVNFRLPMFTPEGNRAWLARGSEARFISREQVHVKELTLSVFSKTLENKVETLILSPEATVYPAQSVVTGPDSIRIINDEFEATGYDWRYTHKDQFNWNIKINQRARVVFRASITGLLQ
jgi:lipopolysaccharide export system protein LptC